jgi:hypothetical protein
LPYRHCELRPLRYVLASTLYTDELDKERNPLFPSPSVPVEVFISADKFSIIDDGGENKSLLSRLESFVADGAVQAFAPISGGRAYLDKKSTFSAQPFKWRKGVNLSKLKRILDKEPDYFKK